MQIKNFPLGALGTNCYILYKNKKAIIIDPGAEGDKVINWLTEEGVEPLAILLTHAHFDHIGAVEQLRNHYNIKVYMHALEKEWLKEPTLNGSSRFFGGEIKTASPDILLQPGKYQLDIFEMEIFHTPGHSPGSISFYFEKEGIIISGDVLFHRSIGRTDLPGGDFSVLEESIQRTIYPLADQTIVYPGHGPQTTIGEEKRLNPFVNAI
ncbi:MBL fold metallo-hydrolase [Ornithinibacillus halotolerans]|uniref:Hydroxyacylglutathione hydrolase n=1 Tax=Ornithinibacillus halotolerans TaxID=1274357 RepID=A0A916RTK5_9BACI|nr:MBL fold metallo-hydrolase [Ornithinibacillus halotolerans]GGA68350.1 hydroxyacylglutathione hydrolase [Ornithinibacillus halotolerans]